MGNNKLLQSLGLRNFLSYGPNGEILDLLPLNVFIGPNGSGKSNFIQAINILRSYSTGLQKTLREGGGVDHWTWKGHALSPGESLGFDIIATVAYPQGVGPLSHVLQIFSSGGKIEIGTESIQTIPKNASHEEPYFFYHYELDRIPLISERKDHFSLPGSNQNRTERKLDHWKPQPKSIIGQFKDEVHYPELTYLDNVYQNIYLFRNALIGYSSSLRGPQNVNLSTDFLSENGNNISLVINRLASQPEIKKRLLNYLEKFYPYLEDFRPQIEGGTIDTCFLERGLFEATPSLRFSDGTLRFLCLLAILCHPEPPPLICIEDAEIGLHPDVFPLLAQLLEEAAEKTQIIVTTQSDELISSFSHRPEAVVVCERDEAGSHLRRLDREQLKDWLDKYSLGHLWRMGEIGGNL
jgi:predicted ATPase